MTINTISGTYGPIVLGNGSYAASITVTATGEILQGLSADVNEASVTNRGSISGNPGQSGFEGPNGNFYPASNGGIGVDLTTSFDTVTNFNVITGGAGAAGSAYEGSTAGGVGVVLASTGDALYNEVGANITGGNGGYAVHGGGAGGTGVELTHAAAAYNYGHIAGGAGGAAGLSDQYGPGGNGGTGLTLSSGATLTNTGSIAGGAGGIGLRPFPGGYTALAFGNGGAGVYVNGGTLTTSGTISGGAGGVSGDAVQFGSAASTLVVDPGATFNGQVAGNSNDVLALGGTAAGTLTGFGTQFTGFGELQFQAEAHWTVDTTEAGLQSHTPSVTGFAAGDTIDITDVPFGKNVTDDFSGGVLAIDYRGSPIFDINFDNPSGTKFFLAADASGNGIDISLGTACYQRGTRIRTPRGEVPIEQLSVGDEVLTANGERKAIRWLGHRRIDCQRHPNPTLVWPIRIETGALGMHVPTRDLWVSPGHSLYLEGVLIQAESLVNGASIVQVRQAQVQYWHVELDSHDLVLAEGAPSESYLDTGNRSAFSNGGEFTEAYPDFMPKHWSETCVPLILEGEPIARAKRSLLERAIALGYTLTDESDLHVLADGERIEPIELAQTTESGQARVAFAIPPERQSIELRCRTFVPTHIDPSNPDSRVLGVYVRRLQIDGEDVPLDDAAAFAHGWHGLEDDGHAPPHRWSMDRMPLPAGARIIVMDWFKGRRHWMRPTRQSVHLIESG